MPVDMTGTPLSAWDRTPSHVGHAAVTAAASAQTWLAENSLRGSPVPSPGPRVSNSPSVGTSYDLPTGAERSSPTDASQESGPSVPNCQRTNPDEPMSSPASELVSDQRPPAAAARRRRSGSSVVTTSGTWLDDSHVSGDVLMHSSPLGTTLRAVYGMPSAASSASEPVEGQPIPESAAVTDSAVDPESVTDGNSAAEAEAEAEAQSLTLVAEAPPPVSEEESVGPICEELSETAAASVARDSETSTPKGNTRACLPAIAEKPVEVEFESKRARKMRLRSESASVKDKAVQTSPVEQEGGIDSRRRGGSMFWRAGVLLILVLLLSGGGLLAFQLYSGRTFGRAQHCDQTTQTQDSPNPVVEDRVTVPTVQGPSPSAQEYPHSIVEEGEQELQGVPQSHPPESAETHFVEPTVLSTAPAAALVSTSLFSVLSQSEEPRMTADDAAINTGLHTAVLPLVKPEVASGGGAGPSLTPPGQCKDIFNAPVSEAVLDAPALNPERDESPQFTDSVEQLGVTQSEGLPIDKGATVPVVAAALTAAVMMCCALAGFLFMRRSPSAGAFSEHF